MTAVLVQPEAKGCDGVGLSTLRDFSKVRQAGYQWVSLYLGGTYGVKPYAIEAAWAAGLPVMLNYERLASDAKNGYAAGQRAAQTALGQAQALGFHGEAPLPFSAADEHFADLAGAGLDYHRALVDVLHPEGWVGGAYGFREMLALIAQQSWWPDNWPLWHWGGDGSTIYPWTWVKQGPGGSYYDSTIGMNVDKNTLYKPMPFWSGYGTDKIDPVEDDVLTDDDKKWITSERLASEARMTAVARQVVFDVVLGLWREPEIHNYLTMHTDMDLNQIAAAVVAALPPDAGVVDTAVLTDKIAEEFSRRLSHDA